MFDSASLIWQSNQNFLCQQYHNLTILAKSNWPISNGNESADGTNDIQISAKSPLLNPKYDDNNLF